MSTQYLKKKHYVLILRYSVWHKTLIIRHSVLKIRYSVWRASTQYLKNKTLCLTFKTRDSTVFQISLFFWFLCEIPITVSTDDLIFLKYFLDLSTDSSESYENWWQIMAQDSWLEGGWKPVGTPTAQPTATQPSPPPAPHSPAQPPTQPSAAQPSPGGGGGGHPSPAPHSPAQPLRPQAPASIQNNTKCYSLIQNNWFSMINSCGSHKTPDPLGAQMSPWGPRNL